MIFMTTAKNLEERIRKIEERNARVEMDKAWEQSYARKALVVIFTYLAIGFYFQYLGIENAWMNAIVPAVAFLLSTLTLPFFKKVWLRWFYKNSF